LVVEGLTGDNVGNLYTPGRRAGVDTPCPVWRVNIKHPELVTVGFIPAPAGGQCSPSGIAFDKAGKLYVADGSTVYRFTPSAAYPPVAIAFAMDVAGTNGLAFDRDGNLWTGDGTTGQGRVWMITPDGVVSEMFRVQPMANEVNLNDDGIGGVGRDVRTLPPGTITVTPTSRSAANTAGSQPLVANGLAFNLKGDLFIADTARGALWKVEFDRHGNLKSNVGCDETFTGNTLCLDNIFVVHPYLDGVDGFVLDRAGNMWVSANERNAVLVVTPQGETTELFRNPVGPGLLRNGGPLESPTSPYIDGLTLCTANSDGGRRDNAPNSAGEIAPGSDFQGKISCLDQRLSVPGLPLPIH
jgi:sugar lactone lactonase YvrE